MIPGTSSPIFADLDPEVVHAYVESLSPAMNPRDVVTRTLTATDITRNDDEKNADENL